MTNTHGATAYSQMGRYQTPPLTASIQFVDDTDSALQRAWTALIDDLLPLRSLKDDWDGQGAIAPHPALVDGAIRLAQRLLSLQMTPADRVLAGVNGTVFFEWHGPDAYSELEVVSPDMVEVSVVRKGSDRADVFTSSLANW